MTKTDKKKIEQRVVNLRASHDELGHLIESGPKAALRVLDKARDQLYDLVATYDDILKKMSRS